ncbi:MAG: hypothetical protein IKL59_01085 [Clostridia bacterium]|nr:hypothetical protein [Clostridia bacterium]
MNRASSNKLPSSRAKAHKKGSLTLTLTKRIILYGIMILVLCTAQCSFFSALKSFGATPDLILGMLVGIILLDSPSAAAVCALVAGYTIDAIGSVPPSFSPIYYLACVALLSMLSAKMLPRFISYGMLVAAGLIGRAAFTFINMCIASASLPSWRYALTTLAAEAICTLIFCLPIYFLAKLCSAAIGARKKFDFM